MSGVVVEVTATTVAADTTEALSDAVWQLILGQTTRALGWWYD